MSDIDLRQSAFEMLRDTLSAEDGAGSDLAVFRLEEGGEWAEVQGYIDMGHLVSEVVYWASEQAEAIDRMGPAAGCAYCAGAGGYEDYDGEWRECSCQRAARTPSDDEREELANLIPLGFREQDGVRNVYDAADRILTAGFRKADREPSDAAVEAAARAMAHADVTNPDGWVMTEEARNVYSDMARAALIAAQEVRNRG